MLQTSFLLMKSLIKTEIMCFRRSTHFEMEFMCYRILALFGNEFMCDCRVDQRRNKIVQEITRAVAYIFSFYAIIAIEHCFSMHIHSPDPLGGVETAAFGLGFQRLPRDLANVNA